MAPTLLATVSAVNSQTTASVWWSLVAKGCGFAGKVTRGPPNPAMAKALCDQLAEMTPGAERHA